jgi:hypothetical protein
MPNPARQDVRKLYIYVRLPGLDEREDTQKALKPFRALAQPCRTFDGQVQSQPVLLLYIILQPRTA